MYALTADRRDSRAHPGQLDMDGHRQALTAAFPRARRPWQISAGDELQVLLDHPDDALEAGLHLAQTGQWHVGLGVGAVDQPLPETVAEATGEALVHAREAVEAAKRLPCRIALRGPCRAAGSVDDADALLALFSTLRQRRTAAAQEAAALADQGLTQDQISRRLEIDQSSVSRRLRTALWQEEHRARRVLCGLLEAAHRAAVDRDPGED